MQPFLSGPLMFMHCGILHHHRDLMECGGSAADYARSVGALEAGNSDSAFLFRIFVSFYRKGLCVEQAIRATLGLVSQGAPQPCSLNLVATDGETTVLCRHRTPGDDAAPPRLFVKLDEGSVIVASVPVQWAGEGKWAELEPDCVCVIEQGELQWGAPVVAGEGTAETVASEPRVSEAPSVPFGLHRGDALATADTMLRDVVRQSVAAAGARKKEVGRALSLEKKALFDVLRRDMAVSVVRSDALVAAAVEALEAAAEADATCGFGNDGNLARAILSELEASAAERGTPKNASPPPGVGLRKEVRPTERGCMNWGRKMAGKRLEFNKTTCSTRGHTPQDHKPPPKVEEGFLCAHPALTHTPIHTRSHTHNNDSPSCLGKYTGR